MSISAAQVKALREKTDLPMMDCKQALEEAHGDEAKAIEILRKKGHGQAAKRADKATAEGRITFALDPAGGRVAAVELLCETEPVSGTEDFVKLGKAAAEAALKLDQPTADDLLKQASPILGGATIGDALTDAVNRIRENLKFGRIVVLSGHIGHYLHFNSKTAALVQFSGPCPASVGADVCMHIVAMSPPYLKREDVPAHMVEQEQSIAREQVKDKPPQIIEKIVAGKLDRWYSEMTLLEQPFVKDDKKTVGQYVREHGAGLTVTSFVRLAVGTA
ncbi:MAG: translation elongation factor Ts [Phycisphaerales bacterium]|nr:translation elongation factor Ts [Phycisphaerales bacterium]